MQDYDNNTRAKLKRRELHLISASSQMPPLLNWLLSSFVSIILDAGSLCQVIMPTCSFLQHVPC